MVEFLGYGNQEPVWTDQLMQSAGEKARKAQMDEALGAESEVAPVEEENKVVEKIEETVVLAPKDPVVLAETKVKTLAEQPTLNVQTVHREPPKEPVVLAGAKVIEPPIVNGGPQCNGGSEVYENGLDENDNGVESHTTLDNMPDALNALSKEVDAIKTIKKLTRQHELKDQVISELREKVYVTEAIVREVRDSNLQLKDENDRLRRAEYIVNDNIAQLCGDVKTLLLKVEKLKKEKKKLSDELSSLKKSNL